MGRPSTVDLLVLTSLYQPLFILKIFFFQRSQYNEEVSSTEPSRSVSIPCQKPIVPLVTVWCLQDIRQVLP